MSRRSWESAASSRAEQDGWLVRVYGAGDVLTADYRTNRLNLEVDDDGIVVRVGVF